MARDGEAAVLVSLTPSDGAFRYALESQLPGSERREHVSALVPPGAPDPPVVDLAAVRARCTGDRGLESNDPLRHQARTMEFGPRWKSHLDVRYGSDEALAEVRAADATAGDQAYAWHPAIVDAAMTAGLAMAPAGGGDVPLLWVPAGCDVVTLWSPPGPRLLAYARFRRADSPNRVAVFDVTLLDPAGAVLAHFTGLRLRGVEPARLTAALDRTPAPQANHDPVLALAREHGIVEAEGTAALERALAYPSRTVILSSLDVPALAAHLAAKSPAAPAAEGRARRPDGVRTSYVAPRSDLERRVADVWARQLGLNRVGVEDNFFELGGESLVGLRLFAEVRRTFGVALAVDASFRRPRSSRSPTCCSRACREARRRRPPPRHRQRRRPLSSRPAATARGCSACTTRTVTFCCTGTWRGTWAPISRSSPFRPPDSTTRRKRTDRSRRWRAAT